jgi:hypothetical protein
MPAFSRPIRVYARHPRVRAFIAAWNAAQDAPMYLAGPGYGYDPTDLVENIGPWDRMEAALAELVGDPAARLEALYLDLDRRTGMRFDPPPGRAGP